MTRPGGSGDVRLRRAVPADADAVQDLVRAAYRPYLPRIGREPAPMLRDYRQVIAAGTTWVADLAGAVVGVLVLVPSGDHLLIDNVAVAPDRQGGGIGAELLRLAEREAVRAGLPEVRLYTNVAMEENLAYYPRRGYQETRRGTDGDYHRVYFHKRLRPGTD